METQLDYKSIFSGRFNHYIWAFLAIPGIFTFLVIMLALFNMNSLGVLSQDIFEKLTSTKSGVNLFQIPLFIYFELLKNSQAILIGLLGLEAVQFQIEKRNSEIQILMTIIYIIIIFTYGLPEVK